MYPAKACKMIFAHWMDYRANAKNNKDKKMVRID